MKVAKFLMGAIGVSDLVALAYEAVRPELVRWAESDGEDDWDDSVVRLLDKVFGKVVEKLKEEGK